MIPILLVNMFFPNKLFKICIYDKLLTSLRNGQKPDIGPVSHFLSSQVLACLKKINKCL